MSSWLGAVFGCTQAQVVQPRLVRLVVVHAANTGGRNYTANYNAAGDVVIQAVTAPANSDGEHAQIQWVGGVQDLANPNDRRVVPRNAITPLGQPVTISATLRGSDRASITIRPLLTALTALNPDGVNGNVNWYVYRNGASITAEATTDPNTQQAWEYIRWGGRGRAGPTANQRLVPRDSLTPVGTPATVDATIDQHLDVQIEVIPDLVDLTAVTNVFASPVAQTWQAYMEAAETFTVEATTLPNTREAWSRLTWNPAGTAGSALNRQRYPRTAVSDPAITALLPNRPNRTITVNIATVEIEVNDTPAAADDLVQLKCLNPAHDHRTPCRARIAGTATIPTPVVIKNPDGRLRFPTEADRTVALALAADGSWSAFEISGHSGSSAVGDAKIEAHRDTAGGPLLAKQDATVFWFDNTGITITPGGTYQIVGTNFTAVGGNGVDYGAKGRIRPAGVDCTQPQVANLNVGIVQNQPRQVRQLVWGPPTIVWEATAAAATVINIERTFVLDIDAGGIRNDSIASVNPLYDKPGSPDTIDGNSLQRPAGCGGAAFATSNDTPGQGTGGSLIHDVLNIGVKVATATYPSAKVTMDLKFITWMVIYDSVTNDICPYRQRKWELDADSSGWFGLENRIITKKASAAWLEFDTSDIPISGAPYSNDVVVPAEVGQGTISFTKP